MQVSVTVCNVCQDVSKGTRQYEVRGRGRKTKLDLCSEDSEIFDQLLGEVTEPATPPRPTVSTRKHLAGVKYAESSSQGRGFVTITVKVRMNEMDDQSAATLERAIESGSKFLTTLSNILKDAEDARETTVQNP